MKVRTKIDVSYNTGINTTGTGIIEGHIESASWFNEFKSVGVNYVYKTVEGQELSRSAFIVEGENVELLFSSISPNIPDGLDCSTTEETKFYLGFVVEMANVFGIETKDIEIINE